MFFLASAILVSSTINLIFLIEIKRLGSGVQDDNLIDGYYCLHLGQEALLTADQDGMSLQAVADSIRLNISSTRIMFLSGLTRAVVAWPWLVPTFFACIYAALVVAISQIYRINKLLLYPNLVKKRRRSARLTTPC